MKKLFVCLANSWKLGGRCIAGIEVRIEDDQFVVVREGGEPVWIRPVSGNEHGEVPTNAVNAFSLLDVLEIECTQYVPEGAQVENWQFAGNSLKKVGEFPCDAEHLDQLASSPRVALFGNQGKAVHSDAIDEVGHSLLLIRASDAAAHIHQTAAGKDQVRINFLSSWSPYDLAVTDPVADQLLRANLGLLADVNSVYLTLSLGQAHNSFHTKLIAGVVYC